MHPYFCSPLFWAGIALALPQGLRVRRAALRLRPAEGPTEGRCGEGPARRLVGIGDSIVAGVGVEQTAAMLTPRVAAAWAARDRAAVEWQAIGRLGLDAAGTLARLVPKLPPVPVDRFLVSVGVNDVTGLRSLARWRRNLGALLDALHRHSPKAGISLLAIPPLDQFPALPRPLATVLGLRARQFNAAAARQVMRRPAVQHVDYAGFGNLDPQGFAIDGYHPNAEACARLAEVVVAGIPAASASDPPGAMGRA